MKINTLLLTLLISISIPCYTQRAEDYKTLSNDGSWCWFSDPRAVYFKGLYEKTYTGYITSKGDIVISSKNHQTNKETSNTIYKALEVDDHDNPSILILPDGRIMVFFTKHGGTFYYTTSTKPEDISQFAPVHSLDMGRMLCYTNPVLLSEENNRIYVFFRGGKDWKPTYITSDNLGKTWSKPQTFITKKINNIYNRPYTKVVSDGKSNIHFAFTDGHPRDENYNSIYYLRYQAGKFFDASNNKIGDIKHLPIIQEDIPKAYDGIKNNQRAWIWDIAINKNGHPVMVYTTLPEETKHNYYYGVWDGEKWQNSYICSAGSAFPRFKRPKENRDPEPHYSGGIAIDHTNPESVYVSRPSNDRFEIEEWTSTDGGKTFTGKSITSKSLKDNVRPYVVRNAPDFIMPRVLWMNINSYSHYTNFNTSIKGNDLGGKFSNELSKEAITKVSNAVATWQINNFGAVKHHRRDWTNGALYSGMMDWAKVSEDNKYMDWLYKLGWREMWQPHYRMYHADDIVVSQMYLEMYQQYKDADFAYRILGPTKSRIDYVITNPSEADLLYSHKKPQSMERWSWCDALFMAPPVYAKMAKISGEEKYLSFMDKEFKIAYEFLYDKEEYLFYRDHRFFPDKKLEANGAKMFWGRGNGWVMGGLVSILKDLPENSKYRPFYEELFKEMAEKVKCCQDENGFWHASMLDHNSYPNPETSSSAFFTYALAYGINAGLLNKDEYLPRVTKAWKALVSCVFSDGKLGWVQPIGEDPKEVTNEMTEVYGIGAFLHAGTEMIKLIEE